MYLSTGTGSGEGSHEGHGSGYRLSQQPLALTRWGLDFLMQPRPMWVSTQKIGVFTPQIIHLFIGFGFPLFSPSILGFFHPLFLG